jgi:hypothetical protein
MTSELRTLIEAADITGVEIECPECHLTILYPTAKLFKIGPSCPHCNETWFDAYGDARSIATYPAIDSIQHSIQHIAEHLRKMTRADRTDIHAKIRFRINTEPEVAE